MRKKLSIILTICMVLTMLPMASYADANSELTSSVATTGKFADIAGHWASKAIEKWAGLGVVKGDDKGFRPNDSITRAEMAVILDNLMDYQTKANNSFKDVDSNAWYADAVLKANAVGILNGDGAGHASPSAKITREQAAVMLARAFGVEEGLLKGTSFKDAGSISAWAQALVFGMESDKYIGGMGNGNFEPKANITRAQVVTMIDNAVRAYYTAAGTYKDDVAPAVAGGNCVTLVKCDGITIKDAKIAGDLIVSEGVAKGSFTLDGAKIAGQLIVRGGGANSVHVINGAEVKGKVTIEKIDGAIRVVSEGVVIANLEADAEVVLEGDFTNIVIAEGAAAEVRGQVANITVEAKSQVKISKDAKVGTLTVEKDAAGAKVEVSGTVANIKTEAPKTEIRATETAKIAKVEAAVTATDSNVEIDKKAEVKVLDTAASITTSGEGAAQTVTGTGTVTKKKAEPVVAGGGGGGGAPGGGSKPVPALVSASVKGTAVVNAKLQVAPVYSGATGTISYQWYRSATNAAIHVASDTAITTSAVCKLAGDTINNYIYCVVTGTGSTTGGSKYTNVIGPVGAATVPGVVVKNLAFVDNDLDANQIGGTLMWTAPDDESNVTGYYAYSSNDGSAKAHKSEMILVGKTQNELNVPINTPLENYVMVICSNETGEAATYSSIKVIDRTKALTPAAIFEASTMKLTNVDSNMSYSIDGGKNWIKIIQTEVDMSLITGLGDTHGIQIRNDGGGSVVSSDIQRISLTKAETPKAVGVNETVARNDGKLTGLLNGTDYSISTNAGVTWLSKTSDSNGEITGLVPATYQIKINGLGNQLGSDIVTVTISKYVVKSIATLESLSANYTNDSGGALELKNLKIKKFAPNTTSYAVTIYDPDIDSDEHISLSAIVTAGSDATITQNNGVDLVNDSGTAMVIVTAEDKTTTNQYQVDFSVDRSSINVEGWDDITSIKGHATDSGTSIYLSETDSSGNDVKVDFDHLTLSIGNKTLQEGLEYNKFQTDNLAESYDIVVIKKEYLNSLSEGKHEIKFILDKGDFEMTLLQDIYIVPATATIFYDQPEGATLEVYAYRWDDKKYESGTLGELVASGGAVAVSLLDDIVISTSAITVGKQIESLIITESYYGYSESYLVTKKLIENDGQIAWTPYGTVTIDLKLKPETGGDSGGGGSDSKIQTFQSDSSDSGVFHKVLKHQRKE